MTDAEFIKANYDSFVDNVLTNQSPGFWSSTLTDTEDGAGYLFDGLTAAVREWRERLETIEAMENDPHQTEEWWAAIDADIEYQNEFRGED